MHVKRILCLVLFLSGFSASWAMAQADGKAEAKRHFENGVAMQELEDFDGAVVEYEASIALYKTQNALFNLAMCYKAQHRYHKALETFRAILKDYGKGLSAEIRKEVSDNIQQIKKMVAKLEITSNIPQAVVLIDGEQIGTTPLPEPIVLGAGGHRVRVSAEGYEDLEKEVAIVAGQNQVVDFALTPVSAAPAPVAAPVALPMQPTGPPEEQLVVEKALGRNLTADYRRFKRTAASDQMSYAEYQYQVATKKRRQGLLTLAVGTPILVGAGLGLFFGIGAAKNDAPSYALTDSEKAENRGLDVLRFILMGFFDAAAVVTLSVGAAKLAKGSKDRKRLAPLVGKDKPQDQAPAPDGAADEAPPEPDDGVEAESAQPDQSRLARVRFAGLAPLLDREGSPAGLSLGFRF